MRKIFSLASVKMASVGLAIAGVGMTGCMLGPQGSRSQQMSGMPSHDAKLPPPHPANGPTAKGPAIPGQSTGTLPVGSASRAGGFNAGDRSSVQPASYTGGPNGAYGTRSEAPSGMKLQQPQAVQNAGVPHGAMMVMMQPLRGKATQIPFQVSGPMGVTEVLDKTKMASKAKSCEVILYRMTEAGKPQRMEVKMERGRVMLTSDYTVHAGDRLMIIEKNESAIESTLSKWMGAAVPRGR